MSDAGPTSSTTGRASAPLAGWAAGALVFGSSAAVLVVELVALRLLAPYLGLTLETSTLVIGVALAAIALGSWLGGRSADVVLPRRAIAPLLSVSGAAVALTPFVVRGAGALGDGSLLLLAAGLCIIVPGALLSAVTPMVTKLVLTDLHETGSVVGRLSGIGTAGAIVGTVVTGFVLISRVPVSWIMVGLGVVLLLAAVVVEVGVRRRPPVQPLVLVLLGGLGAVVAPGSCDAETTYHCAQVVEDPDRPSGRLLVLDGLRHSYVDLDDPTHLEFGYTQALAGVVDGLLPGDEPLRAYHLGGGGLTFPRYLAATRPGTTSVVSEIDPGVLRVDAERLGARTGPDLEVRVEDGRRGVTRLPDASRDLVVGDAFGGVSVPWHLTTREAVAQVERVLTPTGVYAANLIDFAPLGFARAELATLRQVFDHVALAAEPDTLTRDGGGNLVAIASDRPLDLAAVEVGFETQGLDWDVIDGEALTRWIGDAQVLTDDDAPVDQLLTPHA
ncbi:Spermidine synthase [Nocardioides scoriae]|uniref:Spermidine synthase n=1 Tax=Nocardioides scoriae TaxID=642780 RepID=A0A1H1VWH9_9ACTN|nr:fused MFS/spermidine synthase [Nocardioides scoriae]SDS89065.1 Spermidine synthase [Nocardioides scoriae]